MTLDTHGSLSATRHDPMTAHLVMASMPTVKPVVTPVVTLAALAAFVMLVLTLPATAWAQNCDAQLPSVDAAASAAAGQKFSLIASRCQLGSEAPRVMRAAQLDLYARTTPVAVSLPAPGAAVAGLPPGEAGVAAVVGEGAIAADAAASAVPEPKAASAPATREEARVRNIVPALNNAAQQHNLDPLLLHAVAHVESRHNTNAISPAGARGVLQVMPATARRFGVTDPERSLLDANVNAKVSATYLVKLRDMFGDDLRLMLAAYNAGEGAVLKYGRNIPPYPETQAYVRDVLAVYRHLTSMFAVNDRGGIVARQRSAAAGAAR